MNIITWINTALTAIYVVVTIGILFLNNQSVKAATAANQQQLALQFLEHRLKIYYTLRKWVFTARRFQEDFFGCTSLEVFNADLYYYDQSEKFEAINQQLDNLEAELKNDELLDGQRKQLESTRDFLIKERILKKVAMLDAEEGIIKQIEIFFPDIKFETIVRFTSLFMKVVMKSQPEDIEKLKEIVQEITNEHIVETLWNIIKTNNLKIIADSTWQQSGNPFFSRFRNLLHCNKKGPHFCQK